MSKPGILLDYKGPIDILVTDKLLIQLKENKEFLLLGKLIRKRVYAIVVECLENICRNPAEPSVTPKELYSKIIIRSENNKIYIVSGNPVSYRSREDLVKRLDKLNNMDETAIKDLHEKRINRESLQGENGAGLGFISMILKSRNKIGYSFRPLIEGYLYFEIVITLNRYIMRKLIIDKTSGTPKVVLDPEKNIFLIAGESRPPDVREFYDQILSWLHEFGLHLTRSGNNKEPVVFNFDLEYFNSSSGKLILDICKVLAGMHLRGVNITVNWHFEKEDEDMLEAGKEMSKIVKIPFEYVES